jgi:hypothetical protein
VRDVVFEERSAFGGAEHLKDHVELPEEEDLDKFRTRLDVENMKPTVQPKTKMNHLTPYLNPCKKTPPNNKEG